MLLETLELWVPGSAADCQTSDQACEKAGAQGGSRRVREGGSPLAAPITCPEPAARPGPFTRLVFGAYARARAGQGSQVSALASSPRPARAPAPSYSPSLRFLRGLLRTLATASHPATGINPSGVRAVALADWAGRKSRKRRGRVPVKSKALRYAGPTPSTPVRCFLAWRRPRDAQS